MALLTNIKRVIKEQMPSDVIKWIDQVLIPLNTFMSQVTYALTKQLTITDNMVGSVKTFNLTSDQFPFTFNHGLAGVNPKIVFIGQINDTSASPATFTVAPYAQWFLGNNANTIIIRSITGLDITKTYSVTFVVLGS